MPLNTTTSGNDTLIGHDAGDVELISTNSAGVQGNAGTAFSAVSSNGRYILLGSQATNFAPWANGTYTVYLKDLTTGEVKPIALSAAELSAQGATYGMSVSDDGRSVLFNNNSQISVRDMTTGVSTIVSQHGGQYANSYSNMGVMASDGSFAYISSWATNLGGPGDINVNLYYSALPGGPLTFVPTFGPTSPSSLAYDSRRTDPLGLSADNTKLLFYSGSPDLVPNDTNGVMDLFVKDLTTGAVQRVNTKSSGEQFVGDSTFDGVISHDGTKVAFTLSSGGNLYVKDLLTGTLTLVSHAPDGSVGNYYVQNFAFSADDSTIYFTTEASNLVYGDTAGSGDVFGYGLANGYVTRLVAGNGGAWDISAAGPDAVAFSSRASNLVAGDSNTAMDTFLKYVTGAETLNGGDGNDHIEGRGGNDVLIGGQGNDSLDGGDGYDTAVFTGARADYTVSEAAGTVTLTSLIDGTDQVTKVEQFHFSDGTISLQALLNQPELPANRAPTGTAAALPHGTEDTSYILSAASLLDGFSDPDGDALTVRDLSASHATLSDNGNGTYTVITPANYNGPVVFSYTLSDGRGGTLAATKTLVIDNVNDAITGAPTGVFSAPHDTSTTLTTAALLQGVSDIDGDTLVVTGLTATHATIVNNGDGTFTVTPEAGFIGKSALSYSVSDGHGSVLSASANLFFTGVKAVPTSGDDTLVGRDAGEIELISTTASGVQANANSYVQDVTPDGRYALLGGSATNLSGTTLMTAGVYLKDLLTGEVRVVNQSAAGVLDNSGSYPIGLSDDGTKILFGSVANNLGPLNNGNYQIFLKDMTSGAVSLITATPAGIPGDAGAFWGVIAPDASFALVNSSASNLGNHAPWAWASTDVYLKTLPDGPLTLVPTPNPAWYGNYTQVVKLSDDGTKVLFTSNSSSLVANDFNGATDLFVIDLASGAVQIVNAGPSGAPLPQPTFPSNLEGAFTPDGSKVAFTTNGTGLSATDPHGLAQVYIKDLATGAVTQVTHNALGEAGNAASQVSGFSPDGTLLYFSSTASNLVDGDTNNASDIFAYNLATGAITRVVTGNGDSTYAIATGTDLLFNSLASNLTAVDANGTGDAFRMTITGNDTIDGGDGNDHILGKGGDDVLTGGHGDDTIDGGDGNDTAVFAGARADYTVTQTGDTFTIFNTIDGTDTVTGVEQFRFSDRTLSAANLLNPSPPVPNQAPVGSATGALVHGSEDIAYVVTPASLLQGFSDADGDALSVTGLSATHATVTVNPNGTFKLTPEANYNGPLTLSYTVSDGHGGTIAATQTLTLDAVNDGPTGGATATLAHGTEDTPYIVSAASLLQGFSDADGDSLSVSDFWYTPNTTVVNNGNGTFTVTPGANFSGQTDLYYNISDGHGGGASGHQTITFDPVNDAPVGSPAAYIYTSEDQATTIYPWQLTQGYFDPDGDSLAISNVTANHGTVATDIYGNYTLTPEANFNGTMTVNFTLSDGHGGVTAATQNVWVYAVDDPTTGAPTAVLPHATEDTPFTVTSATLLQGFSDVDDALYVSYVSADNASVVNNYDGTFTITPNANYHGTLNLNYAVVGGYSSLFTSLSVVVDSVNDVPVEAYPYPYGVIVGAEDTPTGIYADTLSGNFGDPDGDTLTISEVTGDHITTSLSGGILTVTPEANYNGMTSLNFTVSDGHGGVVAVSRPYLVYATNDAPTGAPTAVFAHGASNVAYTVSAASLLQGFSDIDGDTLSVSMLQADHATVAANPDGTFTLTPEADYGGPVTLTYKVSDGNGGQLPASQVITFDSTNHAPTGAATAILAHGTEDTSYIVSAASLLQGFSDADGDSLSVTNLTANHGWAYDNGNGTFTLVPDGDYNGAMALNYIVSDGHHGTIAATQSIIFNSTNDAPGGAWAYGSLGVGTNYDNVIAASLLLAGYTDSDGDPLMVTNLSVPHATVTDDGHGNFIIRGETNFTGWSTLDYTVSDGHGNALAVSNLIYFIQSNADPVANADTATTTQNTAVTISFSKLLANDTDADGDLIRVTNVYDATHGSVVISGTSVIFTPDAGYTGAATFHYAIADARDGFNDGIVTVNVTAPTPSSGGFIRLDNGNNTANYATAKAAVQVQAMGGNDDLTGSKYADSLNGGDGNDVLRGGAGNDTLTGGKGGDRMQGGAGNDKFVFNAGDLAVTSQTGGQIDQIIDFHGASTTNSAIEQDYLNFVGFGAGAKLTFDHYGSTHSMQYYKVTDPTDTTHNGIILVQMADGTAKLSLADYVFSH